MRDEGLERAIEAAGGVGALARGLSIRQPSVSSWERVPAERVLAVEAVTGVRREKLRPDLYPDAPMVASHANRLDPIAAPHVIDAIESARASEYLLLARLLRTAPTQDLLDEIAGLSGDVSPLGLAHIELAEAAGRVSEKDAASEFFTLFIGVGRGELLPYASFYLTGFLHERPLARLRQELGELGIERAEGNFDPEDHLGLLFEVMGGFANGTFAADLATQRAFFKRHIATWALRLFADIGVSPAAKFYKAVAMVGREFLAIEEAAFEIDD